MRRRLSAWPLIGALLAGMIATAPAIAAPGSGCGMVITQSTTLTANIGPCGKGGIVIAADGIRVDLGGHSIFGKSGPGDGAGILFDGVSGAWVLNGTVHGFDAGIAIVGGDTNTVWAMTIRDNIGNLKGSRPAYGDGVVIRSSSLNWVTRSTIVNNGPFGGVSVVGDATTPSDSNVIERNRIIDNDVDRAAANESDGIRVEGPNATGTTILDNTILANGRHGIAVLDDQGSGLPNAGLFIRENVITGNGFHGMGNAKGDGILVSSGADNALVFENEVTGNAGSGIRFGAGAGRILFNTVTGNVLYPGIVGAFDLVDESATCAGNEWAGNTFGSANQACIA